MLVFNSFIGKLQFMSTYKKNNSLTSLKWQPHLTMTRLSFTLYGIWIPVMFSIHFCIQECKYDKIVWRRTVGKTRKLIRFILILASLTSNNHSQMVFADVMSTSFADKLCLHTSIPAEYMTASSLSWYRLIVFRALHGVFFRFRDKSAHDYCCFDVPR